MDSPYAWPGDEPFDQFGRLVVSLFYALAYFQEVLGSPILTSGGDLAFFRL